MIDQQELSQRVDKEVRYMIGELTMQTIVLRQLLEMRTPVSASPENQPAQPPRPHPNPTPQPIPPNPNPTPPRTPDSPPDHQPNTPPKQGRMNGGRSHING